MWNSVFYNDKGLLLKERIRPYWARILFATTGCKFLPKSVSPIYETWLIDKKHCSFQQSHFDLRNHDNVLATPMSVFCASSSRCRGLVCSVRLWHFLVILTYFSSALPHRVGGNPKRSSQSTNADITSIETVFSSVICRPIGDKWQSKTLFLTIFDLRSSMVLTFSIAAYPVCLRIAWKRQLNQWSLSQWTRRYLWITTENKNSIGTSIVC